MQEQQVDKDFIRENIQKVLMTSHKDTIKHQIKEYPGRFNFACPVCGDSDKNPRKKRGNVWMSNMWFKCFNCDTRMPVIRLFDRYGVNLDFEIREKVNNISIEFTKSQENATLPDNMLWAHSLEKIIEISNTGDHWLTGLMPVQENSPQATYLNNRRIFKDKWLDIYQAYSLVQTKSGKSWQEPVVCMLNRREDELLGMQIRNCRSDKWRKFNTYTWSALNREFELGIDVEDSFSIQYDMLSGLFGITRIDPMKTVTVFEGYFDSLFCPNSLALLGTGRGNAIESLTEAGADIRFLFDNDETGHSKSDQWMSKGYGVFHWKSWIDNMSSRSKDPYKIFHMLSKCKDMNDLAMLFKDPWSTGKMEMFFEDDPLDAILL